MDEATRKALVEAERGSGTIRSKVGPWLLPCIWTECDRPARREHMCVVKEPERNLFYWFCSTRHKMLWVNSPKDMGNLPSGIRGTIS